MLMNKIKTAVLVFLALGAVTVGASVLPFRAPVAAQLPAPVGEKPAQRWEYKVIYSLASNLVMGEAPKDAEQFTKEYNLLAAQGWEYVGPVLVSPGTMQHVGGAFVLFKREKK